MPDDIVFAPPLTPPDQSAEYQPPACRDLLGRLENGAVGVRASDGSLAVRRDEPAGCVLYGPYLHLPAGRYRLSFRCRVDTPRFSAQPVLGVDIIVLSRFQLVWRDFTAAELDAAPSIDFIVSAQHSIEGDNEGRFEFRFFHLGNSGFTITAVELAPLSRDEEPRPQPTSFRLLGRLQKTWRGRRRRDGGASAWRPEPEGLLLYGCWPYLRLARGAYRLVIAADSGKPRVPGEPVLGIEVLADSRWRSRPVWRELARVPEPGGIRLAAREVAADELAGGPLAVDISVPTEMAIEAGADAPVDIRLYHRGNAHLTIRSVDLVKLGDEPEPSENPFPAPRLRPSGRRKVVIIGNCQSETLRQGFVRTEALNKRFEVKYHFVQLPRNLHEFAARDLEACDILLIQDIKLWDEFPLRDCVRTGAEVLRFPLVRFASLWPFDAWNGPGDREAHQREAPNLTFPYLDGLLARLRREIPDREMRFAAYRSLDFSGVVNYQRLHQLEERRLAGIDRQFDMSIGSFVLENFRNRRIFHTTVRPNWEVFALLMRLMARLVGVREPIAMGPGIDPSLRNPQVPVHPKVARDLGVKWADAATRYLNHGRELTWEEYVRRYIEHYG